MLSLCPLTENDRCLISMTGRNEVEVRRASFYKLSGKQSGGDVCYKMVESFI